MDFYTQGAYAALRLVKVADLATAIGRKAVSATMQSLLYPEHEPKAVQVVSPLYREFILGEDPIEANPYSSFDYSDK